MRPLPARRPLRRELPAPDVRAFRSLLNEALTARLSDVDDQAPAYAGERPLAAMTWGVYAFYDYEGEPIYVGQTNESLRVRIRRHLTNQRTDAVGMRVLDPFEILDLEIYPLDDLEGVRRSDAEAKYRLNRLERTIYERSIARSRFGVILNEKIPPNVPILEDDEVPESYRFRLVPEEVLAERRHPDIRLARRAENLSRLSAVIRERGEVSNGLRRVAVVQAVRLAWLGAQRLAEAEGRQVIDYDRLIDLAGLVGGVEEPDFDYDEDEDSWD